MTNKKICLVAGKSGGHIIPCITEAAKFIKENYKILFFSTKTKLDQTVLENNSFNHIQLELENFPYNKIWLYPKFIWNFIQVFLNSRIKELENKTLRRWNSTRLQKTAEALLSKTLKIKISKDEWQMFNWFSYFAYKKGVITCRFDKALKPYLLELKERFVSSDLRMLLPMRSSYSKRMYLLLKEYSKIGSRTFNVEELQEILKVPKSHQERYSKFKSDVLKRAETDINKFTDLEVKLSEKKRAKKVVEITYTIKKNHTDLKTLFRLLKLKKHT